MARIAVQMPDHDITRDVTQNPMLILMRHEEGFEETDPDVAQSEWLAGLAVTAPKLNKD